MIFKAGNFITYIKEMEELINNETNISLNKNLKRLCSFSCKKISSSNNEKRSSINNEISQLIAVYKNLLRRGTPTYSSLFVEKSLTKSFESKIKIKEINTGVIKFNHETLMPDLKKNWINKIAKASCAIDPRFNKENIEISFDSKEEKLFYNMLGDYFGDYFLNLISIHTPIYELIDEDSSDIFIDQKVDFTIETGSIKIIFEVDGQQHNEEKQKSLDKKRVKILKKAGWNVYRIPTKYIKKNSNYLSTIFDEINKMINDDVYFNYLKDNFHNELWKDNLGQRALKLVLTPFAITRLQFLILETLESGVISLSDKKWKIVVIERDLRASELALVDLMQHLEQLLILKGKDCKLPSIELLIYYSKEFSYSDFKIESELKKNKITVKKAPLYKEINNNDSFNANILIDLSVLKYKNDSYISDKIISNHLNNNGIALQVRSLAKQKTFSSISANTPIKFEINKDKKENLRFFLQNIFRKDNFWEGQFEILQRSLNQKDVIGLLPTGGGKSLCYQLSAILQPGITLIIEPLKSLMVDQMDNLLDAGIDKVTYINSDLSPQNKEKVMNKMAKGKYQIVYIAPERFQIRQFRHKIDQMTTTYPVPYLVIDEAHCVSEWGHSFRISYLNLSKIVKKICDYRNYKPITIALTGTASYSVLTDVQREIGVMEEEAKITPKTFNRKELNFIIYKVGSKNKSNKLIGILKDLPIQLGINKNGFFKANGKQTNCGLIFAPHVNGEYGVNKISKLVSKEMSINSSYYSGKPPSNSRFSQKDYDKHKQIVQKKYKKNKFPLLIATKSFGMGIDKPNIRYTVHYGIPESLEGFYQEAGRAGRDRSESICAIIFSDDDPTHADKLLDPSITTDELNKMPPKPWAQQSDIDRVMFFHKKSFQGIKHEIRYSIGFYRKYILRPLKELELHQKTEILVAFTKKYKTDIEKAIHRLAIAGIVEDYTIDYNGNNFEIKLIKKSEEEYIKILQKYIARYKTKEYTAIVEEKIKNKKGNTIVLKMMEFLVEFVYEEIEEKRRNAIRTMVDVCRNSKNDQEIRSAILAYLEKSPITEPLNKMVNQIDPDEWWDIFNLVEDIDSARNLLYGSRRSLESFPDHPGLYFLSSLARMLLPNSNLESVKNDLKAALIRLKKQLPGKSKKQEKIILDYISAYKKRFDILEDSNQILNDFCKIILSEIPKRTLAIKLHSYAPATAENILLSLLKERLSKFNDLNLKGVLND